MPIYVYTCSECELEIEELRPMAQADAPMWCPACGAECGRGITNFAHPARQAQSEPQAVVTPAGIPIHRAGCACCYPSRR
jgi:putative FmdB family regulatory protein